MLKEKRKKNRRQFDSVAMSIHRDNIFVKIKIKQTIVGGGAITSFIKNTIIPALIIVASRIGFLCSLSLPSDVFNIAHSFRLLVSFDYNMCVFFLCIPSLSSYRCATFLLLLALTSSVKQHTARFFPTLLIFFSSSGYNIFFYIVVFLLPFLFSLALHHQFSFRETDYFGWMVRVSFVFRDCFIVVFFLLSFGFFLFWICQMPCIISTLREKKEKRH